LQQQPTTAAPAPREKLTQKINESRESLEQLLEHCGRPAKGLAIFKRGHGDDLLKEWFWFGTSARVGPMDRREFMKDILCDTASAVVMALSKRSKQNEFECAVCGLYKDFAPQIWALTKGRATRKNTGD
jgi:hypothetical protein